MKNISRLFGIVAIATILALLVVVLPAAPALAQDIELDPEEGEIGDRIDVVGDNFDDSTDTVTVNVYIFFAPEEIDEGDDMTDLDVYHRVRTKATDSDGELETYFNVPARLTTGDEDEDVHGGAYFVYTSYQSDGDNIESVNEFTVIAAEIAVDPEEASVGTEVEIIGNDFNGTEEITVEYDGDDIDVESGDSETDRNGEFISTIIIPESTAGAHIIKVSDETGAEAEFEFTVEPEITLNQTRGAAGDSITVNGSGFGEGVDVDVEFDGENVASQETGNFGSFAVAFKVPVKSPGTYNVEASDGERNNAEASFTVAAGVQLSQVAGNVGAQVTINGSGFTPNASVTVTYAPESTPVANPTADASGKFSATFTVPKSTHGPHTVTVSDGTGRAATATFAVESSAPPIPQPLLPLEGSKAKSAASFDWEDVDDPSKPVTYILQIATDDSFTEASILLEKKGITTSEYTLTKEDGKLKSTNEEAPYYWRLRAVDGADNASGWTTPGSFYVGFAFPDLTGWVLYVLMGLAGLLLLLVGFLLGRRAAYL